MKKLFSFSLIALLFISLTSVGQNNTKGYFTSTYGNYTDTITNTGNNSVSVHSQHCGSTVTIQAVLTKISGTLAYSASPIQLQASLDGTNWFNLAGDSIHVVDGASVSGLFVLKNNPYSYYRLTYTGAGTMSATLSGTIWIDAPSGLTVGIYHPLSTYGNTSDTITNTATNYLVQRVQGAYKTVTIQPIVAKISGTPAGTITLQGSIDGVNYSTVSTGYLSILGNYGSGGAATYSVTNTTTQSTGFVVIGNPYQYYRLAYAGSGTMSCTLSANVLPSR